MFVLLVTIQIKPGHKEAFMEALLEDARVSVDDDPVCLRYDVMQDNGDPNRIHLYEVYVDEAGRETARRSAHYLKWRATVKDWFDGEVVVRTATPIYPSEGSWR